MKKLLFITFLSMVWIGLFAQIEQLPAGGTWQTTRGKINDNYTIISDSIQHLKDVTDQNYGFIEDLAARIGPDSITVVNDTVRFWKGGDEIFAVGTGGTGGVTNYNELENLPSIKDTVITYGVQLKDSTSYAPGGYETPTNVDNKILTTIGEGVEGVVLADSQTVFVTPTQLATELTGYTTTEALSDSLSALSIEGALMEADSLTKYVTIKRLTDTIANLRYEIRNFELQFDQIYAALDELAEEDFTPPRFESAEIGDSSSSLLIVVMDAADINPDSIPMSTDFALTENGNAFGIDTLLISNDSIYITLDSTAMYGATYLLSYTRPVSGALQDTIGNKTASWLNKPVTNNVVPSDLLSGLIGYWKFDEADGTTAYDETDNENNGVAQNLSVNSDDAKIGKAYDFTATNSRVYIPFDESIELDSSLTISLWVKIDVLGAYQLMQTYNNNYAQQYDYLLSVNSAGRIRFYCQNTDETLLQSYTNEGILSTDTYYHIVAIAKTGEPLKIYLNNVDVVTTASANWSGVFGVKSIISIGGNGTNTGLNGRLDEVSIYNRVLTADEVEELYNSGNGKTHPFE